MPGAFPGSGLALKLRRLRSRFGITAQRVAVRTHVPWHWRAMAVGAIAALALVLAGWVYDTGRRLGGFDRSASEEEIGMLRARVAELETEVSQLRSVANAGDSNLQIERTTRDQLSRQVKTLEEENNKLKENLAVFENLASGGSKGESISLSRLRVEPDGVRGSYRYRLLVSRQGEQAGQEFHGALQLYVTVLQGESESAIIFPPRPEDPDAAKFAVAFRSFRTLEGHFQIPPESRVKRVEVRLVQGNAVKASQSVTL
jgi:vacuolar-type H+-ATPase subunit I/STV1